MSVVVSPEWARMLGSFENRSAAASPPASPHNLRAHAATINVAAMKNGKIPARARDRFVR